MRGPVVYNYRSFVYNSNRELYSGSNFIKHMGFADTVCRNIFIRTLITEYQG